MSRRPKYPRRVVYVQGFIEYKNPFAKTAGGRLAGGTVDKSVAFARVSARFPLFISLSVESVDLSVSRGRAAMDGWLSSWTDQGGANSRWRAGTGARARASSSQLLTLSRTPPTFCFTWKESKCQSAFVHLCLDTR